MAQGLSTDEVRPTPLDLPRRPAPFGPLARAQRPMPSALFDRARSWSRIRHRRASDDGAVPGVAGQRRACRHARHRLWLRLRRARNCSAQARCSACDGGGHRPAGSARNTRQCDAQPRGGQAHRRPGWSAFDRRLPTSCSPTFSRARWRISRRRSQRLVSDGGRLALSGILRDQAPAVARRYSPWFDMTPATFRDDWARLDGVRNSRLLRMLTQCPNCQTTFRVTAEILRVAEGQVRCGRCQTQFDALEQSD